MEFLIGIAVLGIIIGVAVNSFLQDRGALGFVWSVGLGAMGSLVTGILSLMFGRFLVGEGFDLIFALFSAVAGAIALNFLVWLIKR